MESDGHDGARSSSPMPASQPPRNVTLSLSQLSSSTQRVRVPSVSSSLSVSVAQWSTVHAMKSHAIKEHIMEGYARRDATAIKDLTRIVFADNPSRSSAAAPVPSVRLDPSVCADSDSASPLTHTEPDAAKLDKRRYACTRAVLKCVSTGDLDARDCEQLVLTILNRLFVLSNASLVGTVGTILKGLKYERSTGAQFQLLAPALSLLSKEPTVHGREMNTHDMTPEEFTEQILDTLMQQTWPVKSVVALVGAVEELHLSDRQRTRFIERIAHALETVPPTYFQSLVQQLCVMAHTGHHRLTLRAILNPLNQRNEAVFETLVQGNEEQSPLRWPLSKAEAAKAAAAAGVDPVVNTAHDVDDDAANTDHEIVEMRRLLQEESNAVQAFNFECKRDVALTKTLFEMVQLHETRLTPLCAALILASDQPRRDHRAVEFLVKHVTRTLENFARRAQSPWLEQIEQHGGQGNAVCSELSDVDLELVFRQLAFCMRYGWNAIAHAIIEFGCRLLDTRIKPSAHTSDRDIKLDRITMFDFCFRVDVHEYSTPVNLVHLGAIVLFHAFHFSLAVQIEVCKQLLDRVCTSAIMSPGSPAASTGLAAILVLHQLIRHNPAAMFTPRSPIPAKIRDTLDLLSELTPDRAQALLTALFPLFSLEGESTRGLQDHAILVLRKCMFDSRTTARLTAVTGLLAIIDNSAERVEATQSDAPHAARNTSVASFSLSQYPHAHSFSGPVKVSTGDRELFHGLLGLLRRASEQEQPVRERLYRDLGALYQRRKSLRAYIAELFLSVWRRHFDPRTVHTDAAPINLSACLENEGLTIAEPFPVLLSMLQRCVLKREVDKRGTEHTQEENEAEDMLAVELDRFVDLLSDCVPDDFQLDELLEGKSPESTQKGLHVTALLHGTIQSCIEYVMRCEFEKVSPSSSTPPAHTASTPVTDKWGRLRKLFTLYTDVNDIWLAATKPAVRTKRRADGDGGDTDSEEEGKKRKAKKKTGAKAKGKSSGKGRAGGKAGASSGASKSKADADGDGAALPKPTLFTGILSKSGLLAMFSMLCAIECSDMQSGALTPVTRTDSGILKYMRGNTKLQRFIVDHTLELLHSLSPIASLTRVESSPSDSHLIFSICEEFSKFIAPMLFAQIDKSAGQHTKAKEKSMLALLLELLQQCVTLCAVFGLHGIDRLLLSTMTPQSRLEHEQYESESSHAVVQGGAVPERFSSRLVVMFVSRMQTMIDALLDDNYVRESVAAVELVLSVRRFLMADTSEPARRAVQEYATWSAKLVRERSTKDAHLARALVELYLSFHRSSSLLQVLGELADDVRCILGDYVSGTELTTATQFTIVQENTWARIAQCIMHEINQVIQDAEWVLSDLRSLSASSLPDTDSDSLGVKTLRQSYERGCCVRIHECIRVLESLMSADVKHTNEKDAKPYTEQLIKLATQFYKKSCPKYVIRIVQSLTGLTDLANQFIIHVQVGEGDEAVDESAARIKREQQLIPTLTYSIEQCEAKIIRLDAVSKIDLKRYLHRQRARDFRFRMDQLPSHSSAGKRKSDASTKKSNKKQGSSSKTHFPLDTTGSDLGSDVDEVHEADQPGGVRSTKRARVKNEGNEYSLGTPPKRLKAHDLDIDPIEDRTLHTLTNTKSARSSARVSQQTRS